MAEEELNVPTNEECQNVLKYARHTALVSDRLCGTLLKFASRLEDLKIIPKDRTSKKDRDKHLKKHRLSLAVKDDEIEKMVLKVQSHPDAESIVASLFRDVNIRRVKNVMTKLSNSKEDKKENPEEEDASD